MSKEATVNQVLDFYPRLRGTVLSVWDCVNVIFEMKQIKMMGFWGD